MNDSEKETALDEIEYLKKIVDFFNYVMREEYSWELDETHNEKRMVLKNGRSFSFDEVAQAENSIGVLELCVKGEYDAWLNSTYDDHAKYSM
jgi:hypothetical protein